jgi:hypothetical protein
VVPCFLPSPPAGQLAGLPFSFLNARSQSLLTVSHTCPIAHCCSLLLFSPAAALKSCSRTRSCSPKLLLYAQLLLLAAAHRYCSAAAPCSPLLYSCCSWQLLTVIVLYCSCSPVLLCSCCSLSYCSSAFSCSAQLLILPIAPCAL